MWWMTIASFVFPGFGQGLVHRRVRALAWAVAALAAVLGIVWSVWLLWVALLAHIGSAIDAAMCMRRDARPGGLDRMFGAIVVVIGAIGFGFARLAVEGFHVLGSSMYPTIESDDHIFVDKLTKLWRPIERGELIAHRYPCDRHITYVKRIVAVGGDTVEIRCDVLYINGNAVPHSLVAKDWEYEERDETLRAPIRKNVSRWHEDLDGHGYDVFDGVGDPGERDFPALAPPLVPGCSDAAMFREPRQTPDVKGVLVGTKPSAVPCAPQLHYVVPTGAVFVLGDNRDYSRDSRTWGVVSEGDIIGRVIGVWSNSKLGFLQRFGPVR
jgi:signal peptidase I